MFDLDSGRLLFGGLFVLDAFQNRSQGIERGRLLSAPSLARAIDRRKGIKEKRARIASGDYVHERGTKKRGNTNPKASKRACVNSSNRAAGCRSHDRAPSPRFTFPFLKPSSPSAVPHGRALHLVARALDAPLAGVLIPRHLRRRLRVPASVPRISGAAQAAAAQSVCPFVWGRRSGCQPLPPLP